MPSFGRIGKHSNRSQHNLVEQQQQQQLHLHHQQQQFQIQQQQLQHQQQQHQQQLLSHQQQVAGSGATAPPHHPHQQQASTTATTTTPITTATPANTFSSAPPPVPISGPAPSISGGGRRPSAAGIPISLVGNISVPVSGPNSAGESNITPSSASSIGLSSSESFQQQLPPPQPSLPPQQADNRSIQPQPQQQTPHISSSHQQHQHQHQQHQHQQHQQQQYQQYQHQHQHPHPHHPQLGIQQQSQTGHPLEIFGSNPNNLPTNSIPLNQAGAAYTARQQPHDNFAELVSRSQSARYSQLNPLQTQQPFGIASSSVDSLPHTVSSPAIPPNQPSIPHTQTAPTETKRSTRKLLKNILSGNSSSTSRPTSDHYPDVSYDNSGLTRRPSKRASNTPRGNSLLSRPVDHPDWVSPQSTSSRSHHSPIQPVCDLQDISFVVNSNQELFL